MKRLLLTLCIGILAFAAQAQDFGIGVKAGINYANLSGSDIGSPDPIFKYHAGITARWGLAKTIYVQPEAIFSAKGASSGNVDINMNYIDVPVVLKVKLLDIVSVHAGPQFSYLLSADATGGPEDIDVKEQYKDYDLSAVAGAEYESLFGLSFGVRYNFGLIEIGEDYEQETTVPTFGGGSTTVKTPVKASDAKNGVLQVFAAFTF